MIKTLVLLVALLMAACTEPDAGTQQQRVLRPVQAEAVASDDHLTLPDDQKSWQTVSLPDNWDRTRPDQGGGVWYRIPVELEKNSTVPWGVLLSGFSMNASIWWDEQRRISGGQMTEPIARNWHRPLFASIPVKLATAGHHWVHIYVRGYPNDGGGLGFVSIGAEPVIFPIFEQTEFLQHTLSNVSLFVTLVLALGAFLLWMLRRQQRSLFWMGVSATFWTIAISNFVVRTPPIPRFYWGSLCQASVDMYALALLIMANRILDTPKLQFERALGLVIGFGWLSVALFGGDGDIMKWGMPLHTVAVIFSTYLVWHCWSHWRRTHYRGALVLGVIVSVDLLFGLHDWWAIYFGNQLEQQLLMQFGPTLTLFMVGAWMLYRYTLALKDADEYTRRLELTAARIKSELQQEQQERLTLERRNIVQQERERFTRELHDGIGGQLTALSVMLSDGVYDQRAFGDMINHALLDMRLVIDAIGEDCLDVGMILGMLRYRLDKQIQAHGIAIEWHMESLPQHCELHEGHSLHLLRIIQEAMTNVARHSCARHVAVYVTLITTDYSRQLCVEIADDGCGYDDSAYPGHGLKHMKQRAHLMSGTLRIDSQPGDGTRIQLLLPLP